MVDEEFMNRVRAAFAQELADGTLRVVDHTYWPDAFGNATAVLESADFRLRLLRNRSEYFVELAHPQFPDEWVWLQLVLRAFSNEGEDGHFYDIDFESAARMIRENWDLIVRGFTKDWGRQAREELLCRKEEYNDRVVAWLGTPEGKQWSAERRAVADKELANPSPELLEALMTFEPHQRSKPADAFRPPSLLAQCGLTTFTLLCPGFTETFWLLWPLAILVAWGMGALQRLQVAILESEPNWTRRTVLGACAGVIVGSLATILYQSGATSLTWHTPRIRMALMGLSFVGTIAAAQWTCVRRRRGGKQLIAWLFLAYSLAALSGIPTSPAFFFGSFFVILLIYVWPVGALKKTMNSVAES